VSSACELSDRDEHASAPGDGEDSEEELTEDQLADLRALTPVPEDSEFPWLFYDTIRAAQDETLRMAGNLQLECSLDNFQSSSFGAAAQAKKQAVPLQHSSSFSSQSGLSPRTTYQPALQTSTSFMQSSANLQSTHSFCSSSGLSSTPTFCYVPVQPVQLNSPTVTAVVYPVSLQPGWSGY
jgi:hypothetical protein